MDIAAARKTAPFLLLVAFVLGAAAAVGTASGANSNSNANSSCNSGKANANRCTTTTLPTTTSTTTPTTTTSSTTTSSTTTPTTTTATTTTATTTTSPPANLATNRPVTADSTFSAPYGPQYAVDGDPSTRWASDVVGMPDWLTVDLGSTTTFNEVDVNWEAAYALSYSIQTSSDGSTWATVQGGLNAGGAGWDLRALPTVQARYVRIYITGSAAADTSLWDIRVMDTTGSSAPPPVTTTTTTTASSSTTPWNATWYSQGSPFNTPITASPTIDPNSASYVSVLVNSGLGVNINQGAWTPAVYHANATSPRVSFTMANNWRIDNVPMPAAAAPSADSDGQLAVLDDSTGCEYDFSSAVKHVDGTWTAYGEATFTASGHGVHAPWAARASSDALGAGLIRPSEVQAGVIAHALAISMPMTAASFRWPATTSDGHTTGGLPMGTRLQLSPTFDISVLPADQRVIAKALQTYGAYVVDTSSAIALSAQNTTSTGSYRYPASWSSGLASGATILRNLRVVASPSALSVDSWTATSCAQRYLP
jgi:hypothetical protein